MIGDGCLGALWILDFRDDDSQTYPSEIFSNEICRQTVNQPYYKVEVCGCFDLSGSPEINTGYAPPFIDANIA